MRKRLLGLSVAVLISMIASVAAAADAPHGTAAATAPHGDAGHANVHERRPVEPQPARWPGVTVIVILGMFLAAAIVGPVVRYHAPEEVPDASSHDEHAHGAHDAHRHGAHGHEH